MLKLTVPRATPDQLQRGLEAADAVFREAGVDAAHALAGVFAREGWGHAECKGDIDDSDLEAASVWDQAEGAALQAVLADWDERVPRPWVGRLELVTSRLQLAGRDEALALLRAAALAEDGNSDAFDSGTATLANVVADCIENRFRARELVDGVTIAWTTLSLAGFSPEEPIEPKREAVLNAIMALDVRSQSG